jgi:hypothetical protein
VQADECDRQCVREPAQCSLRRRGRREITGPRDVTCVSYWAGARPLDSTTQDTGPRGAFCSRGVWGLPGCLSGVRVRVRVSSLFAQNLRAWTALRQPLKQAFQPGTALSSFPSLLPFLCIVLPVYLALMLCQ